MKVRELIDKLKNMDMDLDVLTFNGEFHNQVEKIEILNFKIIWEEYYINKKGGKIAIVFS